MKKCIFFFLVAVLLFHTILHINSTTMEIWRSRLFGDLGQRSHVCCLSTFLKSFSSEITGPISFKLPLRPSGKRGKEIINILFRSHDQDGRHAYLC